MTDARAAKLLDEIADLYELERRDECSERLRIGLLERPDDGRFIQWQGLLWHAQGDFAGACRALEVAGLLVPLSIPAQLALADAYARAGKSADARTILRFLAERDDVPTIFLPQLTVGLGRIGEYQLALDVCREASLREPDSDEACYGMAFYMSKLRYPTECVLPLLRRALALEPTRPLYRLALAVVCARSGRRRETYELFCGVEIRNLACASCLQTMIGVFAEFGDNERLAAAEAHVLRVVEHRKRLPSAEAPAATAPAEDSREAQQS